MSTDAAEDTIIISSDDDEDEPSPKVNIYVAW